MKLAHRIVIFVVLWVAVYILGYLYYTHSIEEAGAQAEAVLEGVGASLRSGITSIGSSGTAAIRNALGKSGNDPQASVATPPEEEASTGIGSSGTGTGGGGTAATAGEKEEGDPFAAACSAVISPPPGAAPPSLRAAAALLTVGRTDSRAAVEASVRNQLTAGMA